MNLGVRNLIPHHTGPHICEDLSQMINEWKIPTSKIVSATTDNGANIVCGVKLLLSGSTTDDSSESENQSQNDRHVPCFAHIINLIVSKALGSEKNKNIEHIIEKIKAIVAFFKHSNIAQDMLREEQRKEGKSDGTFLYLIQERATRWNSTFYCLERFVLLSGHVGKILLSPVHKKPPAMLTPSEIATIEKCLQLLRPFEAVTKDISGEKYISGSLVIPLANCLRTSSDRICISNAEVELIQKELKIQMVKRLTPLESNTLLTAATILDPRFKKIHFASPINAANAIRVVSNEIKKELRKQGSGSPPQAGTSSYNSTSTRTSCGDIWSIHDEFAAIQNQNLEDVGGHGGSQQGLPSELKLYLNQPIQPRDRDPLEYWKNSKNAFPGTYQVFSKYPTVLGASVPSERLVSLLNNVCTDQRSRLTPKHSDQLVFLGSLDDEYWEI